MVISIIYVKKKNSMWLGYNGDPNGILVQILGQNTEKNFQRYTYFTWRLICLEGRK